MTFAVHTTLRAARLILTSCTLTFMLLIPVTAAAEQTPTALVPAPMRAGMDAAETNAALASFAEAFMASDLFAAAAHFSPDAEILHSFNDGRVIRVRGDAALNEWLSARAFVLPLRWTLMRYTDVAALDGDSHDAYAVVFTILQLSTRYDDGSAALEYYEAPWLLDADLAPDGTIARLYVAYSVAGLNQTYTTPPTGTISAGPDLAAYPHVARTEASPSSIADPAPPAFASIRVGPERGDHTWLTAAFVAALAVAALRLRSAGRPTRTIA